MLDWFKYYATCEDIREHIKGRLKHGDLTKEADDELGAVAALLYSREEE
jgi:hypothetical protein